MPKREHCFVDETEYIIGNRSTTYAWQFTRNNNLDTQCFKIHPTEDLYEDERRDERQDWISWVNKKELLQIDLWFSEESTFSVHRHVNLISEIEKHE